MLKPQDLSGCITALITPMCERAGAVVVDFDGLVSLTRAQVDAGVSGILFAATTGQSACLSGEEKIAVIAVGVQAARQRAEELGRGVRVLAAAGSNSTGEAIRCSQEILDTTEVDALLHVTGYYNNPPQEGLQRHFTAVADACARWETPVVLYNVPSRTASDLAAETTIALAGHPSIVAIKEASGDLDKVQAILDGTDREQFAVVSGEDHLVAEIVKRGGVGVISASANVWPAEFERVARLALAGRHEQAAELQQALLPCIEAVFSAKNPIPLAAMQNTRLRLPLVDIQDLEPTAREKAEQAIAAAMAIESFPQMDD